MVAFYFRDHMPEALQTMQVGTWRNMLAAERPDVAWFGTSGIRRGAKVWEVWHLDFCR
jgi:hypothetical protein